MATKTPKPKSCKACSKPFFPFNSLQKTCSAKCAKKFEESKAKEKRMKTREKKRVSVSYLSKTADALWSQCVKIRYGHACAYCGTDENLNSHHIFGRNNKSVRWELDNGICLCAGHHTFSSTFSAHKTPTEFTYWLESLPEFGREGLKALSDKAQATLKVTPDYLSAQIAYLKDFKNLACEE